MTEFSPIHEAKVDGRPALVDFDTKQFAVLPDDYILVRMGNQIMGARRKSALGSIAIKWKPLPADARIETAAPPEP